MAKRKQKAMQNDTERKVIRKKHSTSGQIDERRQIENRVGHTKSSEESEASKLASKEDLSSVPDIPSQKKTRRSKKVPSIDPLLEDTTGMPVKKTQNSKAGNSVKPSISINSVDAIVDEGKLQVEPIPVTKRKRKSSIPISHERSKVKKKLLEENTVNNGLIFMKNGLSESNTVQSNEFDISVENSIQQTIQPSDKCEIQDQDNQIYLKEKSRVNGETFSNKSETNNDVTIGTGTEQFPLNKSQLNTINTNCPISTDDETNDEREKISKYVSKESEEVNVNAVAEGDQSKLVSDTKIIDSASLTTVKTKRNKQNGRRRVKNNGTLKNTTKNNKFTRQWVDLCAVSKSNILDTALELNEILTRRKANNDMINGTIYVISSDNETNVERKEIKKEASKEIHPVYVNAVLEADHPMLASDTKIIDSVSLNTKKIKMNKQNGHNRVKNNGTMKNTTTINKSTHQLVNLSAVPKTNILDTNLELTEIQTRGKTNNDVTIGTGTKQLTSKKSQLRATNINCSICTNHETDVERKKISKDASKEIEQVNVNAVSEVDQSNLVCDTKIIDSVGLNTEKTKANKPNGHSRVKNNGKVKNATKYHKSTQQSGNLNVVSKLNIPDTDLELNEILTRGKQKSVSTTNEETIDKDQQPLNERKQKVVKTSLKTAKDQIASKVHRRHKDAATRKKRRKRKPSLTLGKKNNRAKRKATTDRTPVRIEAETLPAEDQDTRDQTEEESALINTNSDTVNDRSLSNENKPAQEIKNLTIKILRLEDQPLLDILKEMNNSRYRNYCVERDKTHNSPKKNLKESAKCDSIEEQFDQIEINNCDSLMTERAEQNTNNLLENTGNKSSPDLIQDDVPPPSEDILNCLEDNNMEKPNDPYLSENCNEENAMNEQNLQLLSADSTCSILRMLEDTSDFMGDFPVNNHMPSDDFLNSPDELFDSISKEILTEIGYSKNLEYSEPALDYDKEFSDSNSNTCTADNIDALNELIISNSQSESEPKNNVEELNDNIANSDEDLTDESDISSREEVVSGLPGVRNKRVKSTSSTDKTNQETNPRSHKEFVCNICMATFHRGKQLSAHNGHHKRNPFWKKGIHSTYSSKQKNNDDQKRKTGNNLNISSLQCTENKENKVIEKNSCTQNFCHPPTYTDDKVELKSGALEKNVENQMERSTISCNAKRRRGRPRRKILDEAVSDKMDDGAISIETLTPIQDEPSTKTTSEICVKEHVPSTSTSNDEETACANILMPNANEPQPTITESMQNDAYVQQCKLPPENEWLIDTEEESEDETEAVSISTDIDEYHDQSNESEKDNLGESPKKYRKWHCNLCNENFALIRNYLRHKYYSHNDETAVHICDNCTKVLTSVAMVNIHVCTNVKTWSCKRCNMNFRNSLSLTRHNMQKHFETIGPHKCDVCQLNFLTKYMLDRHKYMHHTITDYANSDICFSSVLENCNLSSGLHPALRDDRHSVEDLKARSTTVLNLVNYRNRMIGSIKKLYLHNVFTMPETSEPLQNVSKDLGITYTFCNGEEKFNCELCNVTCLTRLEVELHLKMQHNVNVDTCQLCGDLYIPTNFMVHLIERHIVFDSGDADKYPIKSVRHAEDRFTYDLDTPYGLLKILGSKRFMSLKQYDPLYNEQTAEYINCTTCSEEYLNIEGYIFHQVQTHDTTCIFCNIQFQHSSQAVQHKIDTHKSIASYIWGVRKIIQTIVIMENYYSSLDQITSELDNVNLSNGELCSTSSEENSEEYIPSSRVELKEV